MGILDTKVLKGYIKLCNDGWEQGWHERNGGNLTYRMTSSEVEECKPYFNYSKPWINMGVKAENLKGEFFISTGTGRYFQNVMREPQDNICIVEINDQGDSYRIVWGLVKGGRPTSEFPSHFMNHSVRAQVTGGRCRVIYHAHPANLIAMTFITPLDSRTFTRNLWRSMTECPVIFPAGVGVVKWMVPGGSEIAYATSELMKKYDAAVWAHHGIFCSGEDFDGTFGLMHTIEKAAEIYLKVLSTGKPVLSTITDDDIRAIGRDFNLELNEEFLD